MDETTIVVKTSKKLRDEAKKKEKLALWEGISAEMDREKGVKSFSSVEDLIRDLRL